MGKRVKLDMSQTWNTEPIQHSVLQDENKSVTMLGYRD
jgi:hypothetical protein